MVVARVEEDSEGMREPKEWSVVVVWKGRGEREPAEFGVSDTNEIYYQN